MAIPGMFWVPKIKADPTTNANYAYVGGEATPGEHNTIRLKSIGSASRYGTIELDVDEITAETVLSIVLNYGSRQGEFRISSGNTALQSGATAYNLNSAGLTGLSGTISPTQITSNQNNYDPGGWANTPVTTPASVLRLTSDASRNITGLVPASYLDGQLVLIHNVGSSNIVLEDENASSTAANRFALTGDITLTPDACCLLQYDATSARWRAISAPTATSTTMRLPGWFPFALDPSQLSGVAAVTVSGNTTYNTEADYVQVASTFKITGAVTLTAKLGLLIICKDFVIDNASGVLDASGGAGAAPVGQTGGVGGVSSGLGSDAGGGADGKGPPNGNGNTGGTPTAMTATANVPDLTWDTQANELLNFTDALYSSATFPTAARWGLGGRGGGGGGGGGATGGFTGGNGGSGGAATSFANAVGGVFGAGGAASTNGSAGSVAVVNTLSDGYAQIFANLLAMWYYGAGTGGAGGGSGGRNGSGTSGAGGGGGGGGNPVFIICDTFSNAGTIKTDGGAGGAGGPASSSSTAFGEGGGGGGGGAGNLLIITRSLLAQGTLTANGGALGAGSASQNGANGGNGAAGTDGHLVIVRGA